jgi:hypothetical protein
MPYMPPSRAFVVEESTFLAKGSSSGLQSPQLAEPRLLEARTFGMAAGGGSTYA